MLNINVICVGKLKEQYLKDAVSEYSKRLSKYCKLNFIELSDEKLPDKINDSIIQDIKNKEAVKILNSIKKDSFVLTLDLKGKEYTSENFSKKIEDITVRGFSSITFIIGGTLGLTNEVLQKSNELICFSKMTFPHQLIRVFLLEQVFRAFKISNNETYHW
jgi:23S rRNA (pseudouridine1915-N3)-methyltransferase